MGILSLFTTISTFLWSSQTIDFEMPPVTLTSGSLFLSFLALHIRFKIKLSQEPSLEANLASPQLHSKTPCISKASTSGICKNRDFLF